MWLPRGVSFSWRNIGFPLAPLLSLWLWPAVHVYQHGDGSACTNVLCA
uniref:Uncharacterized protein n=1 Tax=Anguilla anguilla TaxID=7936 RepID=A0A0E9UL64_ANGAN